MTLSDHPLRVDRSAKTLRELALEKMREAILEMRFKPGERLVERDLGAQLGVSRTIVREVLRHLETEGLVATQQHRGPIVAITTADEARQIYEIRGVLEGIAARACAESKDARVVEALEARLAGIKAAYAADDLAQVLTETTEFYRILFTASRRDIAWGIVNSITVRINHLRSMTIKTPGRNVEGPLQMQRIVDAIKKGDGNGAYNAALAHVTHASSIAQALLAE
jgi:DNA-binding GntR family transcriptional regulator